MALKYRYEMPQMMRNLGYYTFGIGKMHWFPQKALHGFHATLIERVAGWKVPISSAITGNGFNCRHPAKTRILRVSAGTTMPPVSIS